MKKVLFGIFAHPDDEAFGPSASLYDAAQNNVDVHLVVVTDGEQGNNPDQVSDLANVRLKEWEESRKRIGAKSGLALHYPDGGLDNKLYLEISQKIFDHIKNTTSEYSESIELDLITLDNQGLSGHLDHIAVSFITTHVYLKLSQQENINISVGNLKYYCLCLELVPKSNINWLYMPAGRPDEYFDETFDYTDIYDQKLHIMKAHHSQRKDMEAILSEYHNKHACLKDHFRYHRA